MEIFNKKDLKSLMEVTDEYCISMYMPTHRTGREQLQDPVRLGNLITDAQNKLGKYGLRKPDIQKLMHPAEVLFSDRDFWQHQSDGLAIFLSPGFSQSYRLPIRFDELMVIGKKFHIKPLLPLLNEDGQFYILALSLNGLRLFLGTRDTVNELDISSIPSSIQEALYTDDPEKHLDFHTGTKNPNPATAGSRPAVYHGQGVQSEEEDKTNIRRYFQIINKDLNDLLEDKSIPMVLACVDYLLPIYREVNDYPYLLNDGIPGNPNEIDAKTLHKRAWNLIEPIFGKRQRDALDRFKQLHGNQSGLASDDLETVVKAAKFGMVDTLFFPLGVQQVGRYDINKDKVVLNQGPDPENEDLLNYAARQTLKNSGQVFVLEPDELPGDADLAAILRFAKQEQT